MSRGPGRIQRALLDYLAADPKGTFGDNGPVDCSITEAARAVYGTTEPTEAQRASVRRAARQLAGRGLVEILGRRGWDAQPDRYYIRQGRRIQLSETFIRRPLTKAEQAAERRFLRRLC